jgi:AraC family transcriptional regulator
MQVTITQSPALNLVGLKADVALDPNQTRALRQKFGPWRAKIENRADDNTYAVDIYPGNYLKDFKPQTVFEKWAAVAVKEKPKSLANPLQFLEIKPALYAIFQHQGSASTVGQTYNYVLNQWLPQSGYKLVARPHVAVMPPKYQPQDPKAQEEIWIPITKVNH